MTTSLSFQSYQEEWLKDVCLEDQTTTDLGRRFAHKLLTQWLDVDDSSEDLINCDGSGDGGIDIAYLHRGEGEGTGHTWYLIQSKYGKAFRGNATLWAESQKVIDTLDGKNKRLSSLTQELIERLKIFRKQSSDLDHIKLVFATEEPLTDDQKRGLLDVLAMGRQRLGPLFDIDAISIQNIYLRNQETTVSSDLPRLNVPIKADLISSGKELLLGSVSLLDLYHFLKAYKWQTGDLNQIYERNVRHFLGFQRKVNKTMRQTLREEPEHFGLYNNGITIVVEDFYYNQDGTIQLVEPNIVNGCQTSQTIWTICYELLESGGTGTDKTIKYWKEKAAQGIVITKIVKVHAEQEKLLENITRYTNSQNAIQDKDFLALTADCKKWAKEMAATHKIFLEIQRGGWEARRARQKQHPTIDQFTRSANVFELIKVYASGWLGEAGNAWGRNRQFLPNGKAYKEITQMKDKNQSFGVEDLYVAYLLQEAAASYKFGRNAKVPSRRSAKFLYYLVVVELLKGLMARASMNTTPKNITCALTKLFSSSNQDVIDTLLSTAINVIDVYMNPGEEDSLFNEPGFKTRFNNNVSNYLKAEELGKKEFSPCLHSQLRAAHMFLLNSKQGGASISTAILDIIKA